MTYEDFIEENHAEFAREYENDRNDAAWDDATVCAEFEEWLDSKERDEMDEATGFDVAFIADSPDKYMTKENMPLPEECRPVSRKNSPPGIVADHLGKDQRRWYMWGRVCDRLEENDSRGVVATDLMQDGWITEKQALSFLGFLSVAKEIVPSGYADVGIGRKMARLTTYRRAA